MSESLMNNFISQKDRDNATYELPFPGPCLQMARIWMISSMVLNLFGGSIIWILFIKEHVRWIYTAMDSKILMFSCSIVHLTPFAIIKFVSNRSV